jgi:predicted transcriptional regulator
MKALEESRTGLKYSDLTLVKHDQTRTDTLRALVRSGLVIEIDERYQLTSQGKKALVGLRILEELPE